MGEIFGRLRSRWTKAKVLRCQTSEASGAARRKQGYLLLIAEPNAIVDLLSIDPGLDEFFKCFIVIAAFVYYQFVQFGISGYPGNAILFKQPFEYRLDADEIHPNRAAAYLNEAALHCVHHRFKPVVRPEFLVDAVQMIP